MRAFEQPYWKTANREDLIRPERIIASSSDVIDIDDVGQIPATVVPEAFDECRATMREHLVPLRIGSRGHDKRIQPERLDLDRLADAGRDDVITDACIHPGELKSCAAGRQQAIGIEPDAEAGSR